MSAIHSTVSPPLPTPPSARRWWVLCGGVLVQLVLGGVYAWSVLGKALTSPDAMGVSPGVAAIPFEVAIGMIVVGTMVGGRLQDRHGPRLVAMTGVVIYACGVLMASRATDAQSWWWLIVGYGVMGGFGLGMAYIVPVALLQKWFPEHPTLVTGVAVGGFGFGTVLTSPIVQALIQQNPRYPASALLPLGLGYLVVGLVGAWLLRAPVATTSHTSSRHGLTVGEALRTPHWYALTALLWLGVATGISLISMCAMTATDVGGYSTSAAAVLVGALGVCNGGGRVLWAAIAERIGQYRALAAVLALIGCGLLCIPWARTPWAFTVVAALVYLCYGGVFGVLPGTAGRVFGVRHAGAIYGVMLVGWSAGGVLGPLLMGVLVGSEKHYLLGYTVLGLVALAATAIPVALQRMSPPELQECEIPRQGFKEG